MGAEYGAEEGDGCCVLVCLPLGKGRGRGGRGQGGRGGGVNEDEGYGLM